MERKYTAYILKDESSYSVLFPDVDGCWTAGESVEEAIDNARDALVGHLAALHQEKMPLPDPRPFADATIDEETLDGFDGIATKTMIPVTMPGVVTRMSLTMDSYMIEQIDRISTNRSAYIASLVEADLRHRMGS